MYEVWVRQCSHSNPQSDPVSRSLKPDDVAYGIIDLFFKPPVAMHCSLRTEGDELIHPLKKVSDLLLCDYGTKNHPLELYVPSELI